MPQSAVVAGGDTATNAASDSIAHCIALLDSIAANPSAFEDARFRPLRVSLRGAYAGLEGSREYTGKAGKGEKSTASSRGTLAYGQQRQLRLEAQVRLFLDIEGKQ